MLRTTRIISLTFLGVVQRLISKQQNAHALFRILPLIHIRVILQSEFLKCCLDAASRCVRIHTQHGVIISKRVHIASTKHSKKKGAEAKPPTRVGDIPESPLLLFLVGTSLFNLIVLYIKAIV